MQNFLSLGYMLRVLLAVSANFPDNPRIGLNFNVENWPRSSPITDQNSTFRIDPVPCWNVIKNFRQFYV